MTSSVFGRRLILILCDQDRNMYIQRNNYTEDECLPCPPEISTEKITTEEITTEEITTEQATTETTITEEPITFEPMLIVGDDYCTWGPSYWCHNLTTAAECNTTTMCIRIWSEKIEEEIHGRVCKVCKEMVDQSRFNYDIYKTEEALKDTLQKTCDSITIQSAAYLCNSFVDELFSELTEMLKSDLSVARFCKVSGICDLILDD
ncbi:hypothetical protein PV326_000792 [Microctonus aethiopoides]|nr:hypothetical protein PV326_000792 [Microctonus aethiopoides]